MLENALKQAIHASEEERVKIFANIAQTPETSLKELAALLQRPAKHVWSAALQVIRVLGYPGNAAILPLVVEHLVDGNWPGWGDAIDVLRDIDPAVVAPLLVAIFLEQGKKREYWGSDVEGICMALVHLGKEYITPCIPSILFVLARRQGLDDPDPDFLLQVLEKAAI
ncbi:MAG TPA: hypothetical protein VFU49_19515 [Ktedonobacteraceae bacterium]|nr:hypothetical protein [Ktedonobacteraceae bacterium]